MPRLVVTKYFEEDLNALEVTGQPADLEAVDAADVLVEELAGNLGVLESLFQPGLRPDHDPLFEVKRFEEAWNKGLNILIIKYWDFLGSLADYRIFVGYNAQKETYYVLAITHRAVAYDTGHTSFGRLLVRYESCHIPVWR